MNGLIWGTFAPFALRFTVDIQMIRLGYITPTNHTQSYTKTGSCLWALISGKKDELTNRPQSRSSDGELIVM